MQMNRRNLLLVALLSIVFHSAQAQAVYEDCIDTLDQWVKELVEVSPSQMHLIETPFVVRSTGWGCLCPQHYIGVSPGVHDGPWISPIAPEGFPISDSLGHSLIVTGYFTGRWITEDLRNEDSLPSEWLYKMPEFKIESWKPNERDYDVPPPHFVDDKHLLSDPLQLGDIQLNVTNSIQKNEWGTNDTLYTIMATNSRFANNIVCFRYKDDGGDCNNEFWTKETVEIYGDTLEILSHYFQKTGRDPIPEWRKRKYVIGANNEFILVFHRLKYYFSDQWVEEN